MNDDERLMTAHIDGMYLYDEHGRMCGLNDGGSAPAPRFWLGRTASGTVARFGVGLPAELVERLLALCRREPVGSGIDPFPTRWEDYLAVLEEHAAVQRTYCGPMFVCPESMPRQPPAIPITTDNRELLRGGLDGWLVDVEQARPMQAVVVAGRAVSVCASVRITDQAEAAGVETLPEFRCQGHAAAAVAAWAADVQARGSLALYSTWWDNHPSRAVARSLGLRPFGVESNIR